MTNIARKSDGRRIFTAAFRRRQIDRVWRGELTLAQLSRKLGIAESLLRRWKRSILEDTAIARPPGPRTSSPSEMRATRHIRELLHMVSRQKSGLKLLRAELDALNRSPLGATRR